MVVARLRMGAATRALQAAHSVFAAACSMREHAIMMARFYGA
jgi:hypothetical protein